MKVDVRAPGRRLLLAVALLAVAVSCSNWRDQPLAPSEPAAGPKDAPSGPRRLVVSPAGDDRGDGSESDPWRTLAAGMQRLRPGDTLLLRSGRYEERLTRVPISPGRADARITVAAYPGERPVIEGLLWLRRPSYWTLRDLRVTWGAGSRHEHMVKMTDGVGWRIESSELWGARSFAALLVAGTRRGEPSDWSLVGSCIHDTVTTNGSNRDQLVYVNTGLDPGPGLIQGNVLFGAPNGSGVKLGGSAEDSGGAAQVVVRANTIHNVAQGVLVAWRSHDNLIAGNLIGGMGERYAAVRGFELTGPDNVVRGNAAFGAASMVLNDDRFPGLVVADDNRFGRDPNFDAVERCDGYRPQADGFAGFGHLTTTSQGS